jgi:glycosyltransferase involved in cell wall biosynthesis
MRVLYLIRRDAFDKPGGDLFQIQNYSKSLSKYNVHSDIFVNIPENFKSYDIIHLTNIDRPLETFYFFEYLKKNGTAKIVISTIHHSYSYIKQYERIHREGILKYLNYFIQEYGSLEKIRNIYRAIFYPDLLPMVASQFLKSTLINQRNILENVDYIFPIADGELQLINDEFSLNLNRYKTIYNGVDVESSPNQACEKVYDVLVAGRIEARKNQISILKSLEKTNLKVAFVGGVNKNHKSYCKLFFQEIEKNPNAVYLGQVQHSDMRSIFSSSKTHISASWFEVASLVDLEAAFYGCNVIASNHGFTNEYLGSYAEYVNPNSLDDIRDKIELSISKKYNLEVQSHILSNFTWEKAAFNLFEIYSSLLSV